MSGSLLNAPLADLTAEALSVWNRIHTAPPEEQLDAWVAFAERAFRLGVKRATSEKP